MHIIAVPDNIHGCLEAFNPFIINFPKSKPISPTPYKLTFCGGALLPLKMFN
jgi:hypothetical protein